MHNMETAPAAGASDTSAECGAPFQQRAGPNPFLHCSITGVIISPRPLGWTTASAGTSLELPNLPQEGIKHSPDPPFTLLWNTIKLLAASPDLASPELQDDMLFPSPAAICAPGRRGWGRASSHRPSHLPLQHGLSLHPGKTGVGMRCCAHHHPLHVSTTHLG